MTKLRNQPSIRGNFSPETATPDTVSSNSLDNTTTTEKGLRNQKGDIRSEPRGNLTLDLATLLVVALDYKLRGHTWTPPDCQFRSEDKQQQRWQCSPSGHFVRGLCNTWYMCMKHMCFHGSSESPLPNSLVGILSNDSSGSINSRKS